MPFATQFVAAKIEATPGTFSVPVFTADTILVRNMKIAPFRTTKLIRNIDQPFAGARPSIQAGQHRGYSYEIELVGSGAANTPVTWQHLLRGALMAVGVPTGTQVGYPLSSVGDGGSLSQLLLKDTLLFESLGCRHNLVFNFPEKAYPFIAFDGIGLFRTQGTVYTTGASTGLVLPTAAPAPVEVNLENTVIALDGFTLGVRNFSLDLGMSPELYSTTNQRTVIFSSSDEKDRRGAKFTITFELPDTGVKSFSAPMAAGTQVAFSLTHGLAAGNIVQIASSSAIIETFELSEESNRVFATMTGVLVPTGAAGNNEFTFVTR
jgi:hypothetical protein